MMFFKNALALVVVAMIACSTSVDAAAALTAATTALSLSSYTPGATDVTVSVGFQAGVAPQAGDTININIVTEDVDTTSTLFKTADTGGAYAALNALDGINFGLDLVSTLVPTMGAQPTVRPGDGWSTSATFGTAVYTQLSAQRAMISFTVTAVSATGEATTSLMIAIDGVTLPSQTALVVFLPTRVGSNYTPLNVLDTAVADLSYPVGSLYILTTPLSAAAVKVAADSCFTAAGVTGTCDDANSLGAAQAATAFQSAYLSGSLSKLHSWYSVSASGSASKLYVTFQDSAVIAVGDKIYVTESSSTGTWVIGTNIAVNPAIQALTGVPSSSTLMANAQAATTAASLLVVITVGATAIPANTIVRLAVSVMVNPTAAATVGDIDVVATGGVWVQTTKSGGRYQTVAPLVAVTTCTNLCVPYWAPTAVDIDGTIFDAGAQLTVAATTTTDTFSAITPTQTSQLPGAANTLTLTFTTTDTGITGVGNFLYVYFPVEYATSMAASVSGVSITLCTSATSCTSTTNLLGGNQVNFVDMTRLELPVLAGATYAALTTYQLTVPLTNPAGAGSFMFSMTSTTNGAGTGTGAGFPAAFSSTALIVNSGSVVSAVTAAFANNTPGSTVDNVLTVSFQDGATLPSGSTITVVLPALFADTTVIATSSAVSGTGVTVSGMSAYSALTLTVTTASEVAAGTAISLLIPLLSSPVGGSYAIQVGTSMSPALVSTTSPGAQIGGDVNVVSVVNNSAVLSVSMSNSVDMLVGEIIMLTFTALTVSTGAVLPQLADTTTPCNGAIDAITPVDATVIATTGTTWGSTTLAATGACIADATSSHISTLSFATAGATITANTIIAFDVTTVNFAADQAYTVALSSSSANAVSAATKKSFGIDTGAEMATLVPSLSTSTPGSASILTITNAVAVTGAAYKLYMPGFAAAIVASPTVSGGTAASWDETNEVLSLTHTTGVGETTFTVAIAQLPAAGSYTFHAWNDAGQSLTTGVTDLLIVDVVDAVTASFSTPYTGAANSKLTFTFASSGVLAPSTSVILTSTGSAGSFGTGVATNPVVEAVSGFGTVTIAGAVYDSSSQAFTLSLGGAGTVAAGQLVTASIVVSTMPTIGGDFFFTVSYGGVVSSSAKTTVMGVISNVSITGLATALTPITATQVYTVTFTSSRATVINTALGAAWVMFGNNANGGQAFPNVATATDGSLIAATVIAEVAPSAVTVLAATGVFTHATQTLFVPVATTSFDVNTPVSFTIAAAHTPVTGTYNVSVKTGGAPNYVMAAVPLSIGGSSGVSVTTSSTISGAPATLTVNFTPQALVATPTANTVTVTFGAFGAGIGAAPAIVLVSGWGSTTATNVVYTAASSQLVFTIATANVASSTALSMTVAVAANPEAGSRHYITIETSVAEGVASSATSPLIISGTAPLATVTSASPSTFDGSMTTIVTLTGTGFGLSSSTPAITYGATGVENTCSSPTYVSATSVTCIVAGVAGQQGTIMFVVAINAIAGPVGGSIVLTTTAPSITSVSPSSGAANTGVIVTLMGSNLGTTTGVAIVSPTGVTGLICAPFTIVSATEVTCTTSNTPSSGVHTFSATTSAGASAPSTMGYEYGVVAPTPTPVAAPTPTPVAAPTPTPVAAPTPTPVAAPTPTPVAAPTPTPATPGSEPTTLGSETDFVLPVVTKEFSAASIYDVNGFNGNGGGTRSTVLNCNQFAGIPSDAVVVEVKLGIYMDYFKPAGGQSLCQLFGAEFGAYYLHSASKSGPYAAVQSVDPRRLGGAGDYAAGAQGRSSTGNGAYSGIGPYWGVRTVGDPGACGHEAAGDVFHCGIAMTVSVSVLNYYSRYAYIAGLNVITESTYMNGVSASAASADDIRSCSDYDTVPAGNLVVKLTMGDFVDYVKPLQSLCSLLASKSPNPWFYHAWSEEGPWKLVWGNHSALLGGWAVYGVDTETVGHTDPDGSVVQRQRREWGTFWGAPAVGGYTAEPGACCHAAAGQIYQFFQKLTIDVKVLGA